MQVNVEPPITPTTIRHLLGLAHSGVAHIAKDQNISPSYVSRIIHRKPPWFDTPMAGMIRQIITAKIKTITQESFRNLHRALWE
jgi:hypothetical protein